MARTRTAEVPAGSGNGRVDPAVAPVSLTAPKRRRPSWVAGGVLAVAMAGLLGAWVFTATSEQMSIVVAARDLGPGEVLGAGDVRVVEMPRTGAVRAVRASQQDLVVGRATRGPVPAGTILNTGLFAEPDAVIPAGMVVVGASLEPGAAPVAGLGAGDRVTLLGVHPTATTSGSGPAEGEGQAAAVVLTQGSVWATEATGSGGSTGRLWVAVLVPESAQGIVAQAAADDRLRLTLSGVGR